MSTYWNCRHPIRRQALEPGLDEPSAVLEERVVLHHVQEWVVRLELDVWL